MMLDPTCSQARATVRGGEGARAVCHSTALAGVPRTVETRYGLRTCMAVDGVRTRAERSSEHPVRPQQHRACGRSGRIAELW